MIDPFYSLRVFWRRSWLTILFLAAIAAAGLGTLGYFTVRYFVGGCQ